MAARFFDPDEDDLFDRIEQRAAQFARYRDTVDPAQASGVNAMAAAYRGTLAPGVVYSLGRAGLAPDSPEAKAIIAASTKKQGFLGDIKGKISGAAIASLGLVGDVADEGYDVLKGVSRGAFAGLGSVKQSVDATFREADQDGEIGLGDWAATGPRIAKNLFGEQTEIGQGVRAIGESFAPGGRAPFKGLDYGTGFFVGGDVKNRQTQAQLAAAPGFTVDGRPVTKTIGRGIAHKIVEDQGSLRHSVLSGLIDGSLTIAADPSTYFGGSAAKAVRNRHSLTGSKGVRDIEVAVGRETPAKRAARVYGAGQATALEYGENAIQHGADNPTVSGLVEKFQRGLITKGELVSELPRLRKQIEVDAGLLTAATRKVSVPETGASWLESRDGVRKVMWLAGQTDFNTIWKTTGKKLPVELVDDLRAADTPEAVRGALAPFLSNGQMSEKIGVSLEGRSPVWAGALGKVRPDKGYYRMTQRVPGRQLMIGDPDDAVHQADLWMRNANLPEDVISRVNGNIAAASKGGRPQVYDAVTGMFTEVEKHLIATGTPKPLARTVTRAWDGYLDDAAYFVDEMAEELSLLKPVMVNGRMTGTPTPHQLNEYLNKAVPLPSIREIKKLSANPLVRAALNEDLKRGKPLFYANEMTDFVTNQVWTTLRLLRGAFVIRNVAEAQSRMAVAGFDNSFTHPIDFLAWAIGDTGKLGKALGKAGVKTGRGKFDAEGNLIRQMSEEAQGADAFSRALQRGGEKYGAGSGGRDIKYVPGALARVDKSDPQFMRAWAGELAKIATDDVQKLVLRNGPEEAKVQFFGSASHKEMLHSKGYVELYGQGRAGADRYIDSLKRRIDIKTGGSVDLQDALRQWRMGGKSLFVKHQINPDFVKQLDDYADFAPQKVVGIRETSVVGDSGGRMTKAVDAAFDLLASRPENFMNNNPVMTQAYWRRMADFTEYLTKADQQTLLTNARKSKLPDELIKKIEKRAAMRSGEATVKDASHFAALRALRDQKRLLYTNADRTQFFDAARAAFVFGDALRNTAMTWSRLFAQNPTAAYRGGLGIQSLRDVDPNGDGNGFFTRDGETGKEVFVIPGTSGMIKMATGLETGGFKAPVSGLNLLGTSVIPSLGPVTGYAAGVILPNEAKWEGITSVVFPFGEPKELIDLAPPWFAKMQTAWGGDNAKHNAQLASATHEVFRYNLSTGKYDPTNPQDMQDAMEDSIGQAKKLFFIRGAVQFWAPSPPSPKFMMYDKDGKFTETFELVRIFGEMYKKDPETATEDFIERYGELALGATVGKTEAIGTSPVNKKALDFAKDHPGTVKRWKPVYGLFMSNEGPFDLKAYGRQRDEGERESKTPEVFVNEVRERMARSLYERKKAQLGITRKELGDDDAKAELRTFKEVLNRDFLFTEGFDTGKNKKIITQLQQAVGDPVLADLPAGRALAGYLTARDRVIAEASRRGIADFSRNKKADDLRAYLRDVGSAALSEYPEFATMYERVFLREVELEE